MSSPGLAASARAVEACPWLSLSAASPCSPTSLPGHPAALAELAALHPGCGLECSCCLRRGRQALRGRPSLGFTVVDRGRLRAADACLVLRRRRHHSPRPRASARQRRAHPGRQLGNVGFLATLPQRAGKTACRDHPRGAYSVVELLTVESQLNGRHHRPSTTSSSVAPQPRAACCNLQKHLGRRHRGQHALRRPHHRLAHRLQAYNLSCGGPICRVGRQGFSCSTSSRRTRSGFRPVILRPDHVISGAQRVAAAGGRGRRRRRPWSARCAAATMCASPLAPHAARLLVRSEGVVLPECRAEALRPPRCSLSSSIDDLVLIARPRLRVLARSQRHHRRDRRRQDAAGPGHRLAYGPEGRRRAGAPRRPQGRSYRRSSRGDEDAGGRPRAAVAAAARGPA